MKRTRYDLGHFSFSCGQVGRLQTLSFIPVVAGDSVGINLEGVFRLSPLRRNLTVDIMVDLFAFFVPYRHVYGQDWIDFILQGNDESIIFPTTELGANNIHYLGVSNLTGSIPRWMTAGYNRIWNRYFRVPTDLTNEDRKSVV